MPLPVYLKGAGTARHHTYIAYSQKNAQKRLPSLKVAKKSLAVFCKAFVVHHVGANPNTFVYPGGIGIIRLLTRK